LASSDSGSTRTWKTEESRKEEGGIGLAMMDELMDGVQIECLANGTIDTIRHRLAMH
jgi:anti-sigma regulatory factor (Ser/Thr protein kinase)